MLLSKAPQWLLNTIFIKLKISNQHLPLKAHLNLALS